MEIPGKATISSVNPCSVCRAANNFTCLRRFAFFCDSGEDSLSGMNALMKSDKRAFESLASVLRLKGEDSEDDPLEDHVLDLKDAR
jgi:hypothetical protein